MPSRPSPASSATPDQSAAEHRTIRDGLKAETAGSCSRTRASPLPSARSRQRGTSSATSLPPPPSAVPRPIDPRPSTLRELIAVLAAGLSPIDLATDALTPSEVVELLPARRRGRKAHKSTAFRWYSSGYRGLRLPYLQVGSQRCTCLRGLQAFLDALTAIARFEQGESAPACAEEFMVRGGRPVRRPDRQLRVEDELKRRHGL